MCLYRHDRGNGSAYTALSADMSCTKAFPAPCVCPSSPCHLQNKAHKQRGLVQTSSCGPLRVSPRPRCYVVHILKKGQYIFTRIYADVCFVVAKCCATTFITLLIPYICSAWVYSSLKRTTGPAGRTSTRHAHHQHRHPALKRSAHTDDTLLTSPNSMTILPQCSWLEVGP